MERGPSKAADRRLESRKNLASSSGKVGITAAPQDTPSSQELKQEPKTVTNVPAPPSKNSPSKAKLQRSANQERKLVTEESQPKGTIAQSNAVVDNSTAVDTVYSNGVQPSAPPYSGPTAGTVQLSSITPSQFPPTAQPASFKMATLSGMPYPLLSAAPPNGNPESEVMLQCLAGLLKGLLPPPAPPACTKEVYVGIPCNADRKCIDKFLGQKRTTARCCQPCCRPPPKATCDSCSKPSPCNPSSKPCSCGKCQPCCGGPVAAPCCVPRCAKRGRKRYKPVKKAGKESEGKSHETIDNGTDAQKQDVAVEVQETKPKVTKRNVVTGMLSKTMVGDIRFAYIRGTPTAKSVTRDIRDYVNSTDDLEDRPTRSSAIVRGRMENEVSRSSKQRIPLEASRNVVSSVEEEDQNHNANSIVNTTSSTNPTAGKKKSKGKFWSIG